MPNMFYFHFSLEEKKFWKKFYISHLHIHNKTWHIKKHHDVNIKKWQWFYVFHNQIQNDNVQIHMRCYNCSRGCVLSKQQSDPDTKILYIIWNNLWWFHSGA